MQVKMWDRFTGSRCRFRNVLKQVKTLSNRDHITPEVSRWYHLKIAQTSEFAFVKYDLTPLEVFASLCFWRNKILKLNITLNDLSRWIDFAVLEKEKTDSHFPGDANRFVKKKNRKKKSTIGFEWFPQTQRSYHSLCMLEDDVSQGENTAKAKSENVRFPRDRDVA